MSFQWMRRAFLALATVSLATLSACGGGEVESQFEPTRVIAFGDGFSDLGQLGTRNTVNDGTINIWAQGVATAYGYNLGPVAAGGTSYATRNARVILKPDPAGSNATPTIAEQVTTFLAGGSLGARDLVLVSGGISDIVAEVARVNAGTQTADQAIANLRQAGRDLGTQVRRLVQAGASHVVVVGSYDMSRTPWAITDGTGTLLNTASARFNEEMLISIVDLGNSVLYVDAAFIFNLMSSQPQTYGMLNSIAPVCTSVDPGPGIGIGAGQVNSALCTPSTVTAGAVYDQYLWADKVYPTPEGHRRFGEFAFTRIRSRW